MTLRSRAGDFQVLAKEIEDCVAANDLGFLSGISKWFLKKSPMIREPERMRPGPVEITASEIREALWRAGGAGVPAGGSFSIEGSLFHKIATGLLAGESGWQNVLTDSDLTDHTKLRRHAYDRFLGPQLMQ